MSVLLRPVSPDLSKLTLLDNDKLDLKTALSNLLAGQILVIRGFETTQNKDTYIKLALEQPIPTTRITYTNPDNKYTYWQPYHVAIDALSINDVYSYSPDSYEFDSIFMVGDVIKYSDTENRLVAGVVAKVYRDAEGHLYYKFTNSDQLYLLEQSGQGLYGEGSDGKKPFIPVADTTKDGNMVILRDDRDSILVPR